MLIQNFAPYFNEVMSRLVILMNITDTDNLPLRSCATDCVGAVATAVGVEIFRVSLFLTIAQPAGSYEIGVQWT